MNDGENYREIGGQVRRPFLYDQYDNPIYSKTFNLDPTFFFSPAYGGTIKAGDIQKQPYRYHPWIHACAWAIARNISRLPKVLVKRDNPDEVIKVKDDRNGILNLINKPNAFQTRLTFIQYVILSLILGSQRNNGTGGQCFIVPRKAIDEDGEDGKVDLSKKEKPDILLPFNDQYIAANKKKGANGLDIFSGWKFEISPAPPIVYAPEEIIRIYLVNPYDMLSGISMYEPAGIAMMMDIQADIYNTRMYANFAVPTGILSSKGTLTPAKRKENLKHWMDMVGGSENAQSTGILDSELTYQNIGLTNVDMQWGEMTEKAFEKILSSFGLNKIALGRYEKLNFATIKEGRKLLWHDTYIPIDEMVLDALNNQWVWYIDDTVMLKSDTDEIEVLRTDYTKPAKAMKDMTDSGIPVSVAARINHIPVTDDDIKKFPHLDEKPESKAPVAMSTDEPEKKTEKQEPEDGTVDVLGTFWADYVERVLTPGEKDYVREFTRFFNSQRNRMQDKVDAWEKENKAVKGGVQKLLGKEDLLLLEQPKIITDKGWKNILKEINVNSKQFLLDLPGEDKAIKKLVKPLVKKQLERTQAKLKEELGELIAFNVTDHTVDTYVNMRMGELHLVNVNTMSKAQDKIAAAIETGVAENQTVSEMAKGIKQAIGDAGIIRVNNAKTIARTETGVITNTARFDAFEAEGIEFHQWLAALDEKTRPEHAETHEKIVKVGEIFYPVGLPYPLYSGGSAYQIINCRCVAIAVLKEGATILVYLRGYAEEIRRAA